MTDSNSSLLRREPLYWQLEKRISSEIGKKYKPGDMLPSELDLCILYGVSQITVRRTLLELVNKGFLTRIQGRGTFVRFPLNTRKSVRPAEHTFKVIIPNPDIFSEEVHPHGWFVLYDIMRGLTEECERRVCSVELISLPSNLTLSKKIGKLSSNGLADGLIFLVHSGYEDVFEYLLKKSIPFVVYASWIKDRKYSQVYIDKETGPYQAVKYLLKLGHRKIGLITSNIKNLQIVPRVTGYKNALQESNAPYDSNLVIESGLSIEDGRTAMKKLLALRKKPTAIFATTDFLAIGAMRCIKGSGLQVPEDISVIGFDDIKLAAQQKPPLTTVKHPRYKAGCELAKLILNIATGKYRSIKPIIKILKTELVIRESTSQLKS